ncbi:MAG: site-specific integrase, partial [Mariniphaga sp.]
MKVHLRKRKQTKDGLISLYLEIYKGTTKTADGKPKGLRSYEYLNLYLIDNAKSAIDKQHNKDTLKLAESIKVKRQNEINTGVHGFTNSELKKAGNFVQYFQKKADERLKSEGNYDNWDSSIKHFKRFAGEHVLFNHINEKLCTDFYHYLENDALKKNDEHLSKSSITSYFNKFRACVKQAVKEKILPYNYAAEVVIPKDKPLKREYLTIDELKALSKADCRYDVLKRAFLFSCLTGLRWSDVQLLKWENVKQEYGAWKITFNQKKTNGLQYLYISDEAKSLMGEPKGKDDRVFIGLKYSDYANVALAQWVLRAGITKHITFHCARHTYAVNQLELGTDIYT